MLTAMMAVWNMEGASHDIWSVNTDFEYHEEQKLEEQAVGETLTDASSRDAAVMPNGNFRPDAVAARSVDGHSIRVNGKTSIRTSIRPPDAHRS